METDWGKIGLASLFLLGTLVVVGGLFLLFRRVLCLRSFVTRHNHVFQLLLSVLFFLGILISVYEGFGISMVASLLSGVGIALGLALQPIMKKMVAGVVFDTTIQSGCRIKCGEYVGVVRTVGMVHTWIELENGNCACIHNDYFNKNPITIIRESKSSVSDLPMALKYW